VEEDPALDGVGDGNATSHLSTDSTESRPELSSLAAEEEGQRRQNIDVFGEVWLDGGCVLGGDCKTEQTLLTVGSIL